MGYMAARKTKASFEPVFAGLGLTGLVAGVGRPWPSDCTLLRFGLRVQLRYLGSLHLDQDI